MTSLTALAHSGHTAAPAFNADFYVAAATVIPVLFLAIAVQQPTYASLLKTGLEAYTRAFQAIRGPRREFSAKVVLSVLSYSATFTIAAVILVSGVAGEIVALASLNARHIVDTQFSVLQSAVILTVAASLAPVAAAFWKAAHAEIQPDPGASEEEAPARGKTSTARNTKSGVRERR